MGFTAVAMDEKTAPRLLLHCLVWPKGGAILNTQTWEDGFGDTLLQALLAPMVRLRSRRVVVSRLRHTASLHDWVLL